MADDALAQHAAGDVAVVLQTRRTDSLRGALMVAEVKRHIKPEPIEGSEAWLKLDAYREEIEAPYTLLFTPVCAYLRLPDGRIQEFDAQDILVAYGATVLPSFDSHGVVELVLRTWLMDLTVGHPRVAPPKGFPDLRGNQVLSEP